MGQPPYSAVADWTRKLIAEHAAGRLTAAVFLCNANTDTGWFGALAEKGYPVLFTKGRIRFRHPDRSGNSPRYGQALFGVEVGRDAFAAAFADVAYVPGPEPPQTNAEKRAAVLALLADPDGAQWSDREIARRCRCSRPFLANLRRSLATVASETTRIYVTKHGTWATMRTGNIGRALATVVASAP